MLRIYKTGILHGIIDQKSGAADREPQHDGLPRHHRHSAADAGDPEGPPPARFTASWCWLPAPRPRFALPSCCAALGGHPVCRGADTGVQALVTRQGRATKTRKGRTATCRCTRHLARHLRGWLRQTPYGRDGDFVFPSFKAKGRVPLSPIVIRRGSSAPCRQGSGSAHSGRGSFRTAQSPALAIELDGEQGRRSSPRRSRPYCDTADSTTLDLYTQAKRR
jgi:hypothetical protein